MSQPIFLICPNTKLLHVFVVLFIGFSLIARWFHTKKWQKCSKNIFRKNQEYPTRVAC